MTFKTFSYALLILVAFSCGDSNTPEETVKKFIDNLSQGNCTEAITVSTGEAQEAIQKNINDGCAVFNSNLRFISCENSEETAKCNCEETRDGIEMDYTYYLKKVEGSWKISEIKGGASPEDYVRKYTELMSTGNCKDAEVYCIGEAKEGLKKIISGGCLAFESAILNINCEESEEAATCVCEEKRDGVRVLFEFNLISGGIGWKISSIEGGESPEDVTRQFVTLMANGNCFDAAQITSGNAHDMVMASIDAGCVTYKNEVKSVTCKERDEYATCRCNESRDGMEMTFDYDLQMIKGHWKVVDYKKDTKGY